MGVGQCVCPAVGGITAGGHFTSPVTYNNSCALPARPTQPGELAFYCSPGATDHFTPEQTVNVSNCFSIADLLAFSTLHAGPDNALGPSPTALYRRRFRWHFTVLSESISLID